jgi:hypothetical protein
MGDQLNRDGNTGRGNGGRFAKGNSGGPGNPFARRIATLRKAMINAVSEKDVMEIIGGIIQKAKTGDIAAAKLALAYVLGAPETCGDPDRAFQDGVRVVRSSSVYTD